MTPAEKAELVELVVERMRDVIRAELGRGKVDERPKDREPPPEAYARVAALRKRRGR